MTRLSREGLWKWQLRAPGRRLCSAPHSVWDLDVHLTLCLGFPIHAVGSHLPMGCHGLPVWGHTGGEHKGVALASLSSRGNR